jgi:hypothetical protein
MTPFLHDKSSKIRKKLVPRFINAELYLILLFGKNSNAFNFMRQCSELCNAMLLILWGNALNIVTQCSGMFRNRKFQTYNSVEPLNLSILSFTPDNQFLIFQLVYLGKFEGYRAKFPNGHQDKTSCRVFDHFRSKTLHETL